jgi:trehalose 6-phosphate phosphatase
LPHALRESRLFARRVAGRWPAVFLDYDGTLTPIVDRPQDAVISPSMKDTVRRLATRCPVCVVTGRDRALVEEWLGVAGLVVAGSHGFDIADQRTGAPVLPDESLVGFEPLLAAITERLRAELAAIPGAMVEPKRFSVAVHYRLVPEPARPAVTAVVQAVLSDHPGQLRLTPGKMVYEIQPKIDWDKGRAVQYLRRVLHADGPEFVSLYLGDDITDEDAFTAVTAHGAGIGIIVADPSDPAQATRRTAADFVLHSVEEVLIFLNRLPR